MAFTQSHNARKIFGFLSITALALFLGIGLLEGGAFQRIENATWDWRARYLAARRQPDPHIKIIAIDQQSLDLLADDTIVWPWPRSMYARVLEFLQRSGARAVAFDLVFAEQACGGVDEDRKFAEAINHAPPTVLSVALHHDAAKRRVEETAAFKAKQNDYQKAHPDIREYLTDPASLHFNSATVPVLDLIESSAHYGTVTGVPDSDGVFRSATAGGWLGDLAVLSLPFQLYSEYDSSPPDLSRFINHDGSLVIGFSGGDGTYQTYNFAAILSSMNALDANEKPLVSPDEFKDAFVLIGPKAAGLLDFRPTPIADRFSGVELNATILDNLLHRSFIQRARLSKVAVCLAILIALVCAIVMFVNALRAQIVFLIFVLSFFVYACFVLALQGIWFPLSIPFAVMILALVLAYAFQYQLEGRQHRFIKDAFQHYVAPSVIDRIVANPASLALGGERRELSIFFSDIQGFTTLSEQIDAARLAEMLNRFLSEMTDILLAHGGTVDKYVGDAIVAFWNAPLTVSDHAERSVRAAMACQKRLDDLAPYFIKEFGTAIRMRIGIHTGEVNVGNFGSRVRFNYTVIGDAANLASRLEGANKAFGTYLLLSSTTKAQLPDTLICRKIAAVKVVGKSEAIDVYEPRAEGARDERFDNARTFFENGEIAKAKALFSQLLEDPVAIKYMERIDKMESSAEHAATSSIWNLSEK